MNEIRIPTAAAMRELGARIALCALPGDVIILDGDLGAGKTTWMQGFAAALGVSELITSPTFVISREHQGARFPVTHIDTYRLSSGAELEDLDIDWASGVVVLEWAEGLVREPTLTLRIEADDDDVRAVRAETNEPRYIACLSAAGEAC